MIRTRDFVLFVVTVLFLLMAVTTTIVLDTNEVVDEEVVLRAGGEDSGGFAEDEQIDRSSIIARLREKILYSETVIEPQPSVVETTDSEESESESELGETTVLERCSTPDDALSIVPKWPLSAIEIEVNGLTRSVFIEEEIVVSEPESQASTSALVETTELVRTNLLTLPQKPQKAVATRCVPSEVVGITDRGILIFNGDMRAYRSTPENVRIGYARDGFPIYGVYDGEVDTCGGYDHPEGYRYTVSSERDYVIGCFVGTPASFTIK